MVVNFILGLRSWYGQHLFMQEVLAWDVSIDNHVSLKNHRIYCSCMVRSRYLLANKIHNKTQQENKCYQHVVRKLITQRNHKETFQCFFYQHQKEKKKSARPWIKLASRMDIFIEDSIFAGSNTSHITCTTKTFRVPN